jgi:hypothetical protein
MADLAFPIHPLAAVVDELVGPVVVFSQNAFWLFSAVGNAQADVPPGHEMIALVHVFDP